MLAPLQSALLDRLAAALPDFFLTGGSALAEFYLGHRESEDLDLFTTSTQAYAEADSAVRRVAADAGLEVVVARSAPQFRRYLLSGADGQVVVDIVLDPVPQIDPAKPVVGGIRTDTLREIAVNKVCALLERWEPRDLLDLLFIEKSGVDVADLLDDARRKDGGLTPAALAWALATAPQVTLPTGMRARVTLEELQVYRAGLIDRLTRLAAPIP